MTTKTYFLVPNFDYPPGSSIALGKLIIDPCSPHRALASLAQDKWPKITTTAQKQRTITRGKGSGANLSATAQILQIIDARIGAGYERDQTIEYSMEALRTEFFTEDPSEDDIKDLLRSPKVQNAMQSIFWSRPLFLITGLKIAEGFSLSTTTTIQRTGNVGATVPIPAAAGVSVGFDAQISRERHQGDSFMADNEVILAYRLLKISRKGWRKARLVFDEHVSRATFLSGGRDDGRSEDIDVENANVADLVEIDDEMNLTLGETVVSSEGDDTILYEYIKE